MKATIGKEIAFKKATKQIPISSVHFVETDKTSKFRHKKL